jgi:hypothetical protein
MKTEIKCRIQNVNYKKKELKVGKERLKKETKELSKEVGRQEQQNRDNHLVRCGWPPHILQLLRCLLSNLRVSYIHLLSMDFSGRLIVCVCCGSLWFGH